MNNPITTPLHAVQYAWGDIMPEPGDAREKAIMISLDRANRPIKLTHVAIGDYCSVRYDLRFVVKQALLDNALSVVFLHSHPNGSPAPGAQDIRETEKLRQGFGVFSISLVDHIIVSPDGSFYSFAEETVHNI